MPLAAEYGEQVKSKIADLKNVGARPGSSITAALFLKEFVDKVGLMKRGVGETVLGETTIELDAGFCHASRKTLVLQRICPRFVVSSPTSQTQDGAVGF